ncbi:MAG TPA: hypothetical protein VGN26_12550 [Armatimonadota bacterium]
MKLSATSAESAVVVEGTPREVSNPTPRFQMSGTTAGAKRPAPTAPEQVTTERIVVQFR